MGLNSKQRIILIIMDFLLLAELTLCIFMSHGNPDTMPYTFLKLYIPLMAVTFFGGRFLIRRSDSADIPPHLRSDGMQEHGLTKDLWQQQNEQHARARQEA